MIGHRFTDFIPDDSSKGGFEDLLKIFLQLVTITSGDVSEALNWLNELDRQYNITGEEYGMGDFIDELKEKGFIKENEDGPTISLTAKSEMTIRRQSLEEIFGKLRKSKEEITELLFQGTEVKLLPTEENIILAILSTRLI